MSQADKFKVPKQQKDQETDSLLRKRAGESEKKDSKKDQQKQKNNIDKLEEEKKKIYEQEKKKIQKKQIQQREPIGAERGYRRGTTLIPVVLVAIVYLIKEYCWELIFPEQEQVKKSEKLLNNFHKPVKKDMFFENREVMYELTNITLQWTQPELENNTKFTQNGRLISDEVFYGIKNDNEYCVKSDAFKFMFPETLFESNKYILLINKTGEENQDGRASIYESLGYEDMFPQLSLGMPDQDIKKHRISLKTTIIETKSANFHKLFTFGSQLFCNFQVYSVIPGFVSLTGKNYITNILKTYSKKEFQDNEKCQANIKKFIPESYRLYNKQECEEFIEYIQTEKYQNLHEQDGIQFIFKAGTSLEGGQGITISTPEEIQNILKVYDYGKKCGENKQTLQVQKYINNPLLYKGHKLELRVYFAITSTNPLKVHVQKIPNVKICAPEFNKKSNEMPVHVCNFSVLSGQEEEPLDSDFSLEYIQEYLKQEGIIPKDQNWVQEIILPQIYTTVSHLVRSTDYEYLKDSRVFQNFEADFMIDDTSNVWFFETNSHPGLLTLSDWRLERHKNMYSDLFEIVLGQLKSRYNRMQLFYKKLYYHIARKEESDISQYKEEFLKLNQNYIDPQHKISKNNSYHKIFDASLEGTKQYLDNLPSECFYQEEL